MKNLKVITSAVPVLLILLCVSFLPIFSNRALPNTPVKTTKNRHHKKEQAWHFRFYCSSGDEFVITGFGGGTSGTINSYYEGCVSGSLVHTGSCSGSYSQSGGVMTIDVTVTPAGHIPEFFNGEPTQFSGQTLTITDCAGY